MTAIRKGFRVNSRTRNIRAVGLRRWRKSSSSASTSNASRERVDHHHQRQQPQRHQVHTLRQGPSEALERIAEIDGAENDPEDEVRQPEFDPQWVTSIEAKLEKACEANAECSWTKLSIYRIPHYLKDGKDKAYVPQIVSLGPYYHGEKRLCQMEQHKWRCLHRILERHNNQIAGYLKSVKDVEEKARACYKETTQMSSPEFVEMMVLDGCFVIELFRGVEEEFETLGYPSNDPVFSNGELMHMIQQDMIMLENQIPLLILDQLYCLQIGHSDETGSLAKLALLFFDPMKPTDGPPRKLANLDSNKLVFDPLPDQGELHCLALFRRSLLHSGVNRAPPKVVSQRRQQLIHSVTELQEAGIKFSKRKTDKFLDIQFEGGSLQIPQLLIHDGTRSLFLNLIAFEQCHFNCKNDITSYVIFMDNLINSPEDVKHLHNCGIIEHWLGSNTEVADLFNRLCQEVVFDINNSYLSTLSEQVNNYSSHRWRRWGFLLKRNYFGNPWLITSFIVALVLLVLTFTQTFYAVYSYYRPRS